MDFIKWAFLAVFLLFHVFLTHIAYF